MNVGAQERYTVILVRNIITDSFKHKKEAVIKEMKWKTAEFQKNQFEFNLFAYERAVESKD